MTACSLESFLTKVPKKLHKGFSYAYVAALNSTGVGGSRGNNFRLGAVMVSSGIPVVAGYNSYKTHTLLGKLSPYPYLHAESACIIRRGLDNCCDTTMYVLRIKKDGSLGTAKPCPVCEKLILDSGIKKCYYSLDNEQFARLELRK
jgi:deoxycytidylate deaminase